MRAQFVELLTQVADAVVAALFGVPTRLEAGQLLALVGDLLVQVGEAILGAVIQVGFGFLRGLIILRIAQQVRLLHLQALHLTGQLIDFLRRGVEFHTQVRGGLVDQIDGLVRQLTARNVPVRQRCGGDQRIIADCDLVVRLVFRGDTTQDRDGVFHARLADEHLLETTFERRILFDVFAVFVQRGRADQTQFAAGQHGLEHVARVHGAFGGARAHDGVDLVDERDDLAVGVLDFLKHGLQTFLEFAAVFRAGDHGAQVKRNELLVLQRGGHVARDDALGEAFDDGGFADAGLAYQHRVVLGAAAQDLHDAADFLITADDRVEFAFLGGCGEVGGVLFQRLVAAFGVRAGDFRAAADLRHGLAQGLRGDVVRLQDVGGLVRGGCGDADEQMLGGNVFVAHLAHFLFGLHQGCVELTAGLRLRGGGTAGGRQVDERVAYCGADALQVAARGFDEPADHALLLGEQRVEQMQYVDLRVSCGGCALRGVGDGFARHCGETVRVHN